MKPSTAGSIPTAQLPRLPDKGCLTRPPDIQRPRDRPSGPVSLHRRPPKPARHRQSPFSCRAAIPRSLRARATRPFTSRHARMEKRVGHRLNTLITLPVPGARKAVKWAYGSTERTARPDSSACFAKDIKLAFFRGSSLTLLPPVNSKNAEARYFIFMRRRNWPRPGLKFGLGRRVNCRGGCERVLLPRLSHMPHTRLFRSRHLPLLRHSCACHRNPVRRVCGAKDSFTRRK